MAHLSEWLATYSETVIQHAVLRLSQDETVKLQVADSVRTFLFALSESAENETIEPISSILVVWVQGRNISPDGDFNSLIPLIVTLKQVMWQAILETCSAEIAVQILTESDVIFTDAVTYLAALENSALLESTRDQLYRAQTRVKHLDKNKSNFIAVAAHELRTPLTLVEGYIDMMGAMSSGLPESQTTMLIDGVKSGTKRLRDIINDIIDVSLLDLKMMEFHFQPIWLNQLLVAAEKNVRKLFSTRTVEINIDRESIPREPTHADPDRLLQAIQKVLMNAIKYTPDGRSVSIQGRSFPGFTDIMIIDNGVGIDPANLTHIFDSFSALGDASLHSSGKTKFKGGGPGLGLPIAKGIIEAHGGTIWAESDGYSEEECPGSIFHIMIPMGTAAPDQTVWRTQKS
ncbi:MAG: HAMP domain-containing histidine kinase [Chloroflexi bacterium]|nr:HAMP domain-containing histidine kinase [Chloroflexota bacterium]MCC6891292.1 HAMP domain-containing histidine kinase [Anaerolineae bacterium]